MRRPQRSEFSYQTNNRALFSHDKSSKDFTKLKRAADLLGGRKKGRCDIGAERCVQIKGFCNDQSSKIYETN